MRTNIRLMAKKKLEDRPALARNIVKGRLAKGWSQAELAHKVGVHPNTIKSIEGGANEGEQPTRQAIADALGIPFRDLYIEHAVAVSAPTETPNWALSLEQRIAHFIEGTESRLREITAQGESERELLKLFRQLPSDASRRHVLDTARKYLLPRRRNRAGRTTAS